MFTYVSTSRNRNTVNSKKSALAPAGNSFWNVPRGEGCNTRVAMPRAVLLRCWLRNQRRALIPRAGVEVLAVGAHAEPDADKRASCRGRGSGRWVNGCGVDHAHPARGRHPRNSDLNFRGVVGGDDSGFHIHRIAPGLRRDPERILGEINGRAHGAFVCVNEEDFVRDCVRRRVEHRGFHGYDPAREPFNVPPAGGTGALVPGAQLADRREGERNRSQLGERDHCPALVHNGREPEQRGSGTVNHGDERFCVIAVHRERPGLRPGRDAIEGRIPCFGVFPHKAGQ